MLHAALEGIGEPAGVAQCWEDATVAAGSEEEGVGGRHHHAPGLVKGREHRLGEEEDVLGTQAEVLVALEEAPGGGVVRGRGHHVEGRARLVAPRDAEEAPGMELEQRAPGHGADRKGPLGAVVPQARGLPAGHQEKTHCAPRQKVLTDGGRLRSQLPLLPAALERKDLRRLEVAAALLLVAFEDSA